MLNCGSSSMKYAVFIDGVARERGLVERLGSGAAEWRRPGHEPRPIPAENHAEAFASLAELSIWSNVDAVAHRVVHGGEQFHTPVLVDETVLAALEANSALAPLHNPANIMGIRAAMAAFPEVPQVAVFDTGFHATLPKHAYLYAIPRSLYERDRYRRFGFHGTSHAFLAQEAARLLARPIEELKLITLHLGNGASACAIRFGESIDTTMGFTPLEGLMMGTRSGDIDPGLVLELARLYGAEATADLLNRASGLLGVAGVSDMRDVHARAEEGDAWAMLALEMYAYRLRKIVGAYVAVLDGVDAIVFSGGVGENDVSLRASVLEGLGVFGFRLDERANRAGETIISSNAYPKALVIRTDEEQAIADAAGRLLGAHRKS